MKNILIIGLGSFGYYVATELYKIEAEVLAVDTNEDNLKSVDQYVSKTIIGDGTNVDFLKSLGINNFDECIVTIGDDFQNSLETVLNLKELGARKIIARASKHSQENLLNKIGADVVVYPEKQLARWTALCCGSNSIYDFMELEDNYGIYEIAVPEEWIDKTLAELNLRRKYNISIIGYKENKSIKLITNSEFKLRNSIRLLILAKEEDANRILLSI